MLIPDETPSSQSRTSDRMTLPDPFRYQRVPVGTSGRRGWGGGASRCARDPPAFEAYLGNGGVGGVQGGKKIALRGRGWHGSPFAQPPPPPPWSPCREGGLGWGCSTCRAGGGGGPTPTYMAQNDPHVALIILTTHMWGKIFE